MLHRGLGRQRQLRLKRVQTAQERTVRSHPHQSPQAARQLLLLLLQKVLLLLLLLLGRQLRVRRKRHLRGNGEWRRNARKLLRRGGS